ncbi:MAG: hypothetical protein MR927_02220 [Campylobacter sp.]|nr:hypothetical protein [Campylobacter sp.]
MWTLFRFFGPAAQHLMRNIFAVLLRCSLAKFGENFRKRYRYGALRLALRQKI